MLDPFGGQNDIFQLFNIFFYQNKEKQKIEQAKINKNTQRGFLYGDVAQIGSTTKNPIILVTSHSRRILNVRVT